MTLAYIVLATLAGGLASVLIAAALTVAVLGRVVKSLVSCVGFTCLTLFPQSLNSTTETRGLSGRSGSVRRTARLLMRSGLHSRKEISTYDLREFS